MFSGMKNSQDKRGHPSTAPVSFPRSRELQRKELLSMALKRTPEREIFACLKYLKAARCQASVASVLESLKELEQHGQSSEPGRLALCRFFQANAYQMRRGLEQGIPQPSPAVIGFDLSCS
jgi:hypothetical protein